MSRYINVGLFTLCVLLVLPGGVLSAQETEEIGDAEWTEEGRNELGLFLGVTDKEGDTGFSAGLDYEYRLSRWFGIGGVIEYTGADFREGLAALAFCWHPWKELKLVGAPALEIEPEENRQGFVFRAGAEYGFALKSGFEIAPALYFDFGQDDVAIVYGAALARKF